MKKQQKSRLFISYFWDITLEAISKKGFWLNIEAEPSFNPQEYIGISRT